MDAISIVGDLFVYLFQLLQMAFQKLSHLVKNLVQDDSTVLFAAKCFCPQLIPQMKQVKQLIEPDTDDELLDFRASYLCDSNVTAIKV